MTVKDILETLSELHILTDQECSKVFYHFLSSRDKEGSLAFFTAMAMIRPNSFEIRRCLAESLMNLGRFGEAAKEWEYIMGTLGRKELNVQARIFRCYQGLDSLEDMSRIYKAMEKTSPEHALSINAKDVYFSCLNARYECSMQFEEEAGLPAEVLGMESFCMKLKDVWSFSLPREKDEVPFIVINYKNGGVTHLYPMVMEDKWYFRVEYLPLASSLVLHWQEKLYRGRVFSKKIIGALQGKNGYLFLDNDTNESVDQFIGRKMMDEEVLKRWNDFLVKAGKLPGFILFVPPSKESVFPQYYPYAMSCRRPIDQLSEIVEKVRLNNFIYPKELLSKDERNYSKTETHYTALGAKKCFEEMAVQYFGVNPNEFLKDKAVFETRDNIGDLGSKVVPMQSSDFIFLQDSHEEKYKIFDNNLVNTGKVEFYKNEQETLLPAKVLFFGDSFYSAIKFYFYICFKEVLICRTVGTIHMDIVEKFRPNYVISEITERFIIQAPKFLEGKEATRHALDFDEKIFL